MRFSTIVMKLGLVMLKTNKKKNNKIGDQKSLLANFIFLKVVVINIRDAFDTNYFTP